MEVVKKKYRLAGFEILEYEEAASTNTLAEGVPQHELSDKKVILTYCQTQGRGQSSNRWESAPGENITMTVIFCPQRLEAGRQFAVSMVVALGCMDFLCRYVGDVTVKWPNDIYVGERKVSGILIEHRIGGVYVQSSLCGIGVNINQERFLSDAPNPVSLYQLIHRKLPLKTTLKELLECIGSRYAHVGDYAGLEADFRKHLYRASGLYDWEDEKGFFQASVAGIDEYGQLVLEDTMGKKRIYAFKEVKYCKNRNL